ncbi:unnamed protein product [Dicrocoelium dendriticum]|nr:unnamed protein product [Dicrocoelium dendriticum]
MRPRTSARLSKRPPPEGRSDISSESGSSVKEETVVRAQSPLTRSRAEEKVELQRLNDRLAQYIDFIRQKSFSPGFTEELDAAAQSIKEAFSNVDGVYVNELSALRKNLDEIALQLSKSQIQLKTVSSARDEAVNELHASKSREAAKSDELASLTSQIARLEKELDHLRPMKLNHDSLLKQHEILKTQLEEETLMRTDLQNRILTLTEQLDFKDKLLKEERAAFSSEAMKIKVQTAAKEVQKYQVKLQSKLDELRKETHCQMQEFMSRLEQNMEVKLDAEKERVRDAERRAKASADELDRSLVQLSDTSNDLIRCRSELDLAQRKIDDLQRSLYSVTNQNTMDADHQSDELRRALDMLNDKIRECNDLAAIKIQLDTEIAMYRSLLESEESRCGLTSSDQRMITKTLFKQGMKRPLDLRECQVDLDAVDLPSYATNTFGSHQKRFRNGIASDGSVRITCSSEGPVHFASADPADGLIRILNASDEVVNMGKWSLRFGPVRPGSEEHTTLHVFPDDHTLGPHSELQLAICSSSGGQIGRIPLRKKQRLPLPSLYLVTDALIWRPYDSSLTLVDADGSTKAICEIKPTGLITRRTNASLEARSDVDSFRITCMANGNLHFEAVESGDGMLLICNAGKETIDLNGWLLTFKTKSHEASRSLSPNGCLEPQSSLRVHVFPSDGLGSGTLPSDKSIVSIFSDAPPSDYYDSTFTLRDSEGQVCAVSEWERITGSTTVPDLANWESEDLEDSTVVEERSRVVSPRSSLSSALAETPIVARYRHFLFPVPNRQRGFCSCPLFTVDLARHFRSFSQAMPKLPTLSQMPLTAFFASPKSLSCTIQEPPNSCEIPSGVTCIELTQSSAESSNTSLKRTCTEDYTNGSCEAVAKRTCFSIPQLGAHDTSALSREKINKTVAELKRQLASRPSRSVLSLIQGMNTEWMCILEKQILSDRFQRLADFIHAERAGTIPIFPPPEQVFSWSQLCPPSTVRVVILGQDPYHGPRQAHGLAFSVQRPLPPPPSLINMYKEIGDDLPSTEPKTPWPPNHGDLTGWGRQGVLLLNAVLTVRASSPNSHKDQGWELLTDAVIRYLSKEKSHLVFMLWGAHAQKQGSGIDPKRHLVLRAPHPSPLSASRGFFGCKHFVRANVFLREHGQPPVNWTHLD